MYRGYNSLQENINVHLMLSREKPGIVKLVTKSMRPNVMSYAPSGKADRAYGFAAISISIRASAEMTTI